jgi:hypothetical protein
MLASAKARAAARCGSAPTRPLGRLLEGRQPAEGWGGRRRGEGVAGEEEEGEGRGASSVLRSRAGCRTRRLRLPQSAGAREEGLPARRPLLSLLLLLLPLLRLRLLLRPQTAPRQAAPRAAAACRGASCLPREETDFFFRGRWGALAFSLPWAAGIGGSRAIPRVGGPAAAAAHRRGRRRQELETRGRTGACSRAAGRCGA